MINRFVKKIGKVLFAGVLKPDLSTVKCDPTAMFSRGCQIDHSSIGRRSSIGRNTKITHTDIGSYCSISWDVTINAVSHDYTKLTTHSFVKRPELGGFVERDLRSYQRVVIGNDVWVGSHAVILPGVHVGDGAVIGAGSVVTKDVPEYSIVVGVPARVIKYRFSNEVIKILKDVKWWLWSDDQIHRNIDVFKHDVDLELLAQVRE